MNSKMKLSIVLLIALCLITSLVAVSCGDGNTDAETDSEPVSTSDNISDENGSADTDSSEETTSEAAVETIGTGDDLSDDGFIKLPWGSSAE